MRLHLPKTLSFGMCPGSLAPPQIVGVFFAKATLTLRPNEAAAWADEPEPVSGDRYADDDPTKALRYPSDFAVLKPRADLLLVGQAHAPGGRPTPAVPVRFAVGPAFSKTLDVAGNRTIRSSFARGTGFSAAEPFASMSFGYENSYGGPGFKFNPLGKGKQGDAAPNVTDSRRPFDSDPVGFGPLSPAWPQRSDLVGSYRGNYMKERWPWFPNDFDWAYFNSAPRDQQIEGYLRGDEEIVLENAHPVHPTLRSKLPGVRVRCFLEDGAAIGQIRFREVPMHLDTLWVDADAAKLVLVWRGHADVRTPKMRELDEILIVMEPLSERPRPAAEYQASLKQPAPPAEPPPPPEHDAVAKSFREMDADIAAMDGKFAAADKDIAAADALLDAELGVLAKDQWPGYAFPTEAPTAAMADVAKEFADSLAALKAANPESAAQFAQIDLSELTTIDGEMAAFREDMEKVRIEAAPPEGARWSRERVIAAAKDKLSLANTDLSGLDLSTLDLAGADLRGAQLAGTNLSATKLARVNFTAANLSAAIMKDADLTGAILDRADLTEAILGGAKLTGLSVNRTTFRNVDLTGADLAQCQGKEADFAKSNLTGSKFAGAKLPSADFSGCKLEQAKFVQAELPAARLEGVKARGIDFTGANIQGLRGDEGSDFAVARFTNANAAKSIFDNSNFDGADFTRSNLTSAQFEGASLRRANFDRANLTGAMFDDASMEQAVLTNANLLRASLEGADLTEAVAGGANCYEAGFWRAATQKADFKNAHRKSSLLE